MGTSGNKSALFTTDGVLIKSRNFTYGVRFFNNNWAEQNPLDWWQSVCENTKSLVDGIDPKDVLAISFSGQMMGCVCVDKKGNPLRDAIIWADMRAVKEAEELSERIPMDRVYHITGHRLSSSYGLEKLLWVKNNQPDIYANTHKFLNAKDFIVLKLTGNFATDYSDASGTNAFDINGFEWSEEIIKSADVKRELFPEVYPSTHIAGEVTAEAARECGVPEGVPVVLGGGDGVCASVGAGSVSEGSTYMCLGSSSWICTTKKTPIFDKQYRTFNWAHIIPGMVSPTGTMQTAGAAFSWVTDIMCREEISQAKAVGKDPYALINEEIGQTKAGSNGLIFLPYLLGERSPRWNPDAKGAFIGMKMEHTRADLLRSVVEGIGMNLNIILNVFREYMEIDEMTAIGGMAQGKVERQIFADIFGLDILNINHSGLATSIGAIVTAGVGAGVFKDFGAIDKFIKISGKETPEKENTALYRRLQSVFDACYQGLKDVYASLTEIS